MNTYLLPKLLREKLTNIQLHDVSLRPNDAYMCISKLSIIVSDNGLSPGRRQAVVWTNAGMLLIGPLATNFSEIWSKFKHFHSRKSILKCRLENGGHFVSASVY